MINLKDVSIITHIRLDNKDRLENLILRNKVLKSLSKNAEFIVVEDDIQEKVKCELDDGDLYGFFKNDKGHMKNHAYNIGASMSTRKYMVFLDADCIIHPKVFKGLVNTDQSTFDGLVYPYNRFALYLTPIAKQMFRQEPTYETLVKMAPTEPFRHGLSGTCGHLYGNCPGGSFMMTHKFFDKVNGFNPEFRGWGYEDTEFLTRIDRLGLTHSHVSGDTNMMFHLHHGETDKSDTAARGKFLGTKDTRNNKRIYEEVAKMSVKEAEAYCKRWTR